MDPAAIKSTLRDKLGITREILALKRVQGEPEGIEPYPERNMMCGIMQDALEENKVYYMTIKNRMCLGCVATGMDISHVRSLLQSTWESQKTAGNCERVKGTSFP